MHVCQIVYHKGINIIEKENLSKITNGLYVFKFSINPFFVES